MRCRECNVDLPKEYTSCPLCGSKVSDDASLIEGIRLAEYPRVKTEPYKRNPFPIFLAVWALVAAVAAVLRAKDLISYNAFAFILSSVPGAWTLIFRPVFVKQPYVGNYVMMNIYPLLLCGFLCSEVKGSVGSFWAYFAPAVFIIILIALITVIFIKPKEARRAAPYPVLSGIFAIVALAVIAVKEQTVPYAWLCVLLLCTLILAILFIISPAATKAELRAKFSIQ